MVLDDLQPLIDGVRPFVEGFAPTTLLALFIGAAYFTLVAVVTLVATFAHGKRSKNAYRVLKVLTRRKPDPPGSGSS